MRPGSTRLVFADPPYNIGIDYGDHHNDLMAPADYLAWCERWIKAVVRILTPDGSMWLLCNHEWSARLQLAMEEAGLHHHQTITWYERFGQCQTRTPRKFNRCSRPLLWMVRNPKRFVFNADAVMTQSDRQTKYHDKRANSAGKVMDDVWDIPGLMDDVWDIPRLAGTHRERIPDFPTQLPEELLRRVVGSASSPGDLVIDPFSGSGTTGAVCLELGRRSIGIEESADFASRSRHRLASVTPGLPFGPPQETNSAPAAVKTPGLPFGLPDD
jgi:site-specific DNA-methyltransferase (adenine-specific)